jgi:hypothetical protein
MKIGFVGSPKVGVWTKTYHENVFGELQELGHTVFCYKPHFDLKEILETPDCILLMGDADYGYRNWLVYAEKIGIPVFAHHHGGPELFGFCDWPEQESFYRGFSEDLSKDRFAGIFFNTPHSLRRFWFYYKDFSMDRQHVVGFPINQYRFRLTPIDKKEELVVVPGRIANDRQPLISMKALEWVKELTIFAAGANPTEFNSLAPEKEYTNTLRQAGFTVNHYAGDGYIKLLKRAKVVFSASLRDTLNTSIVEGVMAGAYPVVPDIEPFTEYLPKECRYSPYNVDEAFNMVCHFLAKKEPFNLDKIKQFDAKCVVKQMVDVIRKSLD